MTNVNDLHKENANKSSHISGNYLNIISSNIIFSSTHCSDEKSFNQLDDKDNSRKNHIKAKMNEQIRKTSKDDQLMKNEKDIALNYKRSEESAAKNKDNSSLNLSQKQDTININGNSDFNNKQFNRVNFSLTNNSNYYSFELYDSPKKQDQKNVKLTKKNLNYNDQLLQISDEIEDKIQINGSSSESMSIESSQTSKFKIKKENQNREPSKASDDDITFFTSNKTYMPNSKADQKYRSVNRNLSIQEPKGVCKTARRPLKQESAKLKARSNSKELHEKRMKQLMQYALDLSQLDQPPINITDSEYDELIQMLNEERRKHISNHNFIEGNKLNQVIKHVIQCHENKKKLELQKQEYQKYVQQRNQFLDSLKKFDQETDQIIIQTQKKNDELLSDLQSRQKAELDDHSSRWMSDAKKRQYNRASQKLITSRNTLEILLNQCRFTEAQDMQAVVDQLEREEEEVAAKQMQHDYEESLKSLSEKQEKEENFLRQKCDMKMAQVKQRRKIERDTLLNKEKKFVKMKDQLSSPEKVWNAMQSQRINEIYTKMQRDSQGKQQDAVSRKKGEVKSLPPIDDKGNSCVVKTARKPMAPTVIKLPPLKMKQPVRKSRLSHTVR